MSVFISDKDTAKLYVQYFRPKKPFLNLIIPSRSFCKLYLKSISPQQYDLFENCCNVMTKTSDHTISFWLSTVSFFISHVQLLLS